MVTEGYIEINRLFGWIFILCSVRFYKNFNLILIPLKKNQNQDKVHS